MTVKLHSNGISRSDQLEQFTIWSRPRAAPAFRLSIVQDSTIERTKSWRICVSDRRKASREGLGDDHERMMMTGQSDEMLNSVALAGKIP